MPSPTATQKEAGAYNELEQPGFGGIDLDNPVPDERRFSDIRNCRLEGTRLVTRRGYKEFDLPAPLINFEEGQRPGFAYPVAECEYRLSKVEYGEQTNYSYNATVLWDGQRVRLWLIRKDKELAQLANPEEKFLITVAEGIYALPTCGVIQYKNSLVVTVFDNALYEVWPKVEAVDIPLGPNTLWGVSKVGKESCPAPVKYSFEQETTGDLIMFIPSSDSTDGVLKLDKPAPGEQFPPSIRLKAQIPYYAADRVSEYTDTVALQSEWAGTNLDFEATGIQRWRKHAKAKAGETTDPRDEHMTRENGWGYRLVPVRKEERPQGRSFTRTGHPSVDFWVPDIVYLAPSIYQVLQSGGSRTVGTPLEDSWGSLIQYTDVRSFSTSYPALGVGFEQEAFPSWSAVEKFRDALLAYFNFSKKLTDGPPGTNTKLWGSDDNLGPYIFTLTHAGYKQAGGVTLGKQLPFRNWLYASELKDAPMTKFVWADLIQSFTGDLTNLSEIRIYRTAHRFTEEKGATGDPLFAEHLYGYVGSIKPDGTFVDDVKDSDIAFGDGPDLHEGLLAGDFSGQLIRGYMQKRVIGNTKTIYRVFQPTLLTQAATVTPPEIPPGSSGITEAKLSSGEISFAYSYVDQDGNESVVRDLNVLTYGDLGEMAIAFALPVGYEPFISGVKLYISKLTNNVRRWYLCQTIDASEGHALVPYFDFDAASSVDLPTGAGKDFYDTGERLWTAPHSLYDWPRANQERDDGELMAFEVVLGELWCLYRGSTHITQLTQQRPRIEEDAKTVGCVAKNCVIKYKKVAFFLSQSGLVFAEGSGVRSYPGWVSSELRKYLEEEIPGLPKYANVSRASISLLSEHNEIWLYIPSSVDLWSQQMGTGVKALPQMLMIYQIPEGDIIAKAENYFFDLHKDFRLERPIVGEVSVPGISWQEFRSERVVFAPHEDGSLWAAYYEAGPKRLRVLNAHVASAKWPSWATAEKPLVLGKPITAKRLRQIGIRAKLDASAKIATGYAGNLYDAEYGHLTTQARFWNFIRPRPERTEEYFSTVPSTAFESGGAYPYMRIVTNPSPSGTHDMRLEAIELYGNLKHQHPG